MANKELKNKKFIILNERQLCDLELLLNGGFAPLNRFMNETDYYSVLNNMRLCTGELWPLPVTLGISEDDMKSFKHEKSIVLRDSQNVPLVLLDIEQIYKPDLMLECKLAYGTTDNNHPYVKLILDQGNVYYISGKLTKINDPLHYDFMDIRLTPRQTKKYFVDNGWKTIVGFQTRNPMHKSHYELTKYAMTIAGTDSKMLLHPVVGITQECDVNYHTRVKCYKKLVKYYPDNTVILSLLPLSMRMAGPREALFHALIRQNYGCTHFVVGRDHAGPSYKDKNGNNFYGPYDAHNLLEKYNDELNIKIIKSKMIVYVKELDDYMPIDKVPENLTILNISGTQQRQMLVAGDDIPGWFSYPDIVKELKKSYVPNNEKGLCIYFVGLSGSGKSTIGNMLKSKLQESVNKDISILDGDVIRQHLSKELTFSKEDRSTNIRRIGYVASEIVKHRGIVLCANIAPYEEDRQYNRKLISKYGYYIEIFVDTKLNVCEDRDIKGLYKLARNGIIKQFTGISDPFETPTNPELIINGNDDINENLNKILDTLKEIQWLQI